MKKILMILGIVILLGGIAGAGYWYWRSYGTSRIENAAEAQQLFELSNKGTLVLEQARLDVIKERLQQSGKLYIPITELSLSEIKSTDGGYIINAYSVLKPVCLEEYYSYTFFVSNNGLITKQNEQLIWESTTKPACIN